MKSLTSKSKMQPAGLLVLAVSVLALGVSGCTPQGQPDGTALVTADGTKKQVPESVKTDAFSYWGLGSMRSIVYELSYPERNGEGEETELRSEQGVSSVVLDSVRENVATFIVRRTGGLSIVGDQTIEARPEGVFTIATSLGEISEPIMELPATLEPGKTWSSQVELQMDAETLLVQSFEYRIVGRESITVPLGTFEAIRVDQTTLLQTKAADKPEIKSNFRGSVWYVRDVGVVKAQSTIEQEGSPTLTVRYEAVRYADDESG